LREALKTYGSSRESLQQVLSHCPGPGRATSRAREMSHL
jgi:hypothetical protein